ncbi:uncharacterized protein LOC134277373 [Saccostrea cucullata]|uniref:uncharacterized protein LOC134277373 n=1 Tax=Saccostrea cuccullata TaxID=36930 RepID=UPI002ED0E155
MLQLLIVVLIHRIEKNPSIGHPRHHTPPSSGTYDQISYHTYFQGSGVLKNGKWILFILFFCLLTQYTTAMYCPESRETVTIVSSCPLNENDWNMKAKEMSCEGKEQSCCPKEKYTYHCLVNDFLNNTVEFCAPKMRLNYCAQYTFYGARIQKNLYTNCTNNSIDCKGFYESNTAYKKSKCFKLRSSQEDEESESTTQTEEKKPETNHFFLNDGLNDGHIIGIAACVAILILVFIVLLKHRKNVKQAICRKDALANQNEIEITNKFLKEKTEEDIESEHLKENGNLQKFL